MPLPRLSHGLTDAAHVIELPPLAAILVHAGKNLLEATVIPMVAFYVLLSVYGLRPALIGAFCWSLAMIVLRALRGHRIPGVLAGGLAMLAMRAALAWVTGSVFLYMLQPAMGQMLVALAFGGSVLLRRPLAGILAKDFVPLPASLLALPKMHHCFRLISLLWALTMGAQAVANVSLLTHASLGWFMLLGKIVGTSIGVTAVAASIYLFLKIMRSERVHLVFHWRAPALAVA